MVEKNCDDCGEKTKVKYLGKIRGKNLCKKCRKVVREKHRKDTIDDAGIKDDLKKLDRKIAGTYRYKKKIVEGVPKIKGSKEQKKKEKSESYLTFYERQALLSILVKKGLSFEEAKERIKELVESQEELRKNMKEKNKSKEEIKTKQQEMLEELWNY